MTSATCAIAQKATETAMLASPSEVEHMKIAFHKRRDLMLEMLSEIPGVRTNIPDGAFYIFLTYLIISVKLMAKNNFKLK